MVVTIIDFLSVCSFPSEPESRGATEPMGVTNGEVRTAQTQPFNPIGSRESWSLWFPWRQSPLPIFYLESIPSERRALIGVLQREV